MKSQAGLMRSMSALEDKLPRLEVLLRQLLAQEEPLTVRLQAATALADISDLQSFHALLSILHNETDARLLMHVIGILARKRSYSAVEPLIDLVTCQGNSAVEKTQVDFYKSDIGVRIRIAAIQGLGRMGDDRAITPMMDMLGDQRENYRIRLAAAECLGRLGDAKALNPLIDIVQDDHEPSQYLKESAVKALGMLGDIRALDPLLEIFDTKKGFKNKFAFLKEQIIEAIGRLGSNHNRAQQALIESLSDVSASIRLSAVESLAEIGDIQCVEKLKLSLYDPEEDVAVAAGATLYHIGGEDLIREILGDSDNLPQFIREELESYVP